MAQHCTSIGGCMNIDRYMVNLFFEVRRNLPKSEQAQMKISSGDLGEQMVAVYQLTEDENIRLLIEVFLERAGDGWIDKIHPKKRYHGISVGRRKRERKQTQQQKKQKTTGYYYRGVRVD